MTTKSERLSKKDKRSDFYFKTFIQKDILIPATTALFTPSPS